jgi:hypothetical protein
MKCRPVTTTSEMAEGQRLRAAASQAVDAQAAAAGAQRLPTERARVAEKRARASYHALVQTVRAIFPPNAAQRKALEVTGPMPDDTAAFIAMATTLFNNASAIPDIATALEKFGYTLQTLDEERKIIAEYQHADQAQVLPKSAAKQATRVQNEALAALQQWIAQYLKIAKIALRSKPERLKALGITTPRSAPQLRAEQQTLTPAI